MRVSHQGETKYRAREYFFDFFCRKCVAVVFLHSHVVSRVVTLSRSFLTLFSIWRKKVQKIWCWVQNPSLKYW